MKEYSKWKDNEVKELFSLIENYKEQNASLLSAFSKYAKNSGRKRNSVRNYYYQELAELKQNPNRAISLNIDVNKHIVSSSVLFSEAETREILTTILKYHSKGLSIRKACLTLAENDINKMVRYQNKYRSVLKNEPELIEEIKKELKITAKENVVPNNVVYLKKQQVKTISESDINSLLLGLIKLVKKSAAESAEKKILADLEISNSTLRKTLTKLSKAEQDLKDLTLKLETQQNEYEKMRLENIYLKTEIANLLNNKPTKKLSTFMAEIKKRDAN